MVLGSRNSLLLYKKSSQSFVPFRELLFLHKKQHHGSSIENSVSLGLFSFKSCKLESKTRGKALGKVATVETYQDAMEPLTQEIVERELDMEEEAAEIDERQRE